MTLPVQIQKIIDDGEAAARVLNALGDAVLKAACSSAMGHGVIINCNFTNYTDDATLHITEAKDGRLNVNIRNTQP